MSNFYYDPWTQKKPVSSIKINRR